MTCTHHEARMSYPTIDTMHPHVRLKQISDLLTKQIWTQAGHIQLEGQRERRHEHHTLQTRGHTDCWPLLQRFNKLSTKHKRCRDDKKYRKKWTGTGRECYTAKH